MYKIELNGIQIGTTKFEYADVPMGVIHGKIDFINISSPYKLFKSHCKKHKVQINVDDKRNRMIDTVVIPELKVYNGNETELKGWGGAITGMDNDEYEITFGGIEWKIMNSEFRNHYVKYYDIKNIKIDLEYKKICNGIIKRNLSLSEWKEIESSDEFQTENYCGGFDATENEFCFSYYDDEKKEYWFQNSYSEIEQISSGKIKEIEICLR